MPKDLISVIVPIYNTGQPLRKCLDSLLAQDYESLEIILVDDGSTDPETLRLCDQYSSSHPQMRLIHKSNGGSSSARNAGIEEARGKYVGFVDSDDWIDSSMYSRLHTLATRYDAPIVLTELTFSDQSRQSDNIGLKEGIYSRNQILHRFLCGQWHSACTHLYDRSLIGNLRFPLKEINEDYIFNFHILLSAEKIAVSPDRFYHYIKQPDSNTTRPASLKHLDWLKHTEEIYRQLTETQPGLYEEAVYQRLFANIVLSNKCLLSMAAGVTDEPYQLYKITTGKLKKWKKDILKNRYLSNKMRIFAIALSLMPGLYKTLVVATLKLKR